MSGKPKLKVCWISAGVSSFVSGWLERKTVDKYIYIDVADQHPDSLRFIRDCEKALGREVEILRSDQYASVEDAIRAAGMIRNAGNNFYPCTSWLKKRVRAMWEYEHRGYEISYVWGFDADETVRADRILEAMTHVSHEFPLIEKQLIKLDAHGICFELDVKRPAMYDLGYSNNNCIGCVRGGMGYWNKIRKDFPEVFASRAKMERDIGNTILRNRATGEPLYLDELNPNAGRMEDEIMEECGIFCMLAME